MIHLAADMGAAESNLYAPIHGQIAESASVTEGQTAKCIVTISKPYPGSTPSITVSWTTVDGTALAGVDYVGASGKVVFNHGGATAFNVSVTLRDPDRIQKATRTFSINLSSTNGSFIGTNAKTFTISDNDPGMIRMLVI